jgi:hypothetical protein
MSKNMDERWVMPSPEAMVEEGLQITKESFPYVIDELMVMPKKPLIVAEGFEFLPELVEPLISIKAQAIWCVPTGAFQRDSFIRRRKGSFHDNTGDPVRAANNHFNRDRLLAQHVQEEATARGLRLLKVDGSLAVDELVSIVERHFEPLLAGDDG